MSSQVIATIAAPYILIEMDVGRWRGDWGLLSGVHHHNDNTPGQLITTPSLDPGDTGHVITSQPDLPPLVTV